MNGTEAIEDDEGNRIFKIQLPNGKTVEATVDPSLKMMDLLISIASNNKLNPTAYQIAQPSKYKGRPPVVYTPSQSAGDIEGGFIMLIPKKEREQFSIYKGKKSGVFEHTVRLTIHSSKNHKMVFRTNPDKTLREVFPKICEERGVEASHYVMRVHKHKEDADPTQTIQSFGVLDFDLVEVVTDSENKKKVGLLGKLKKKEDDDERTEKSKPTANGSNPNHGSHSPENKVQRQNSDGTVPHKPDGGVPPKPEGGVPHKKRPAPLPPSVPAANTQPSDVQAQSNTLEKSKPKMSRVSTKKRRAPAAPVAIVPINIEESSEQKKETNGENAVEGAGDPSQRVGGNDETDAPSQVVTNGGQSMEVVTDGSPPSPAVSHGSSQGLSTSDKDKSSVTGSVSEQDNQDYPDGDASTNPDSSSVNDDEQFSFEEPLAAGQQSLDDVDGENEIVLAKVDGPEVKVAVPESAAPSESNKEQKNHVAEVSSSDVNIERNAEFMVGTLPADIPPPPYIEQVPPPPMPPSPPPPPPQEEENLPVADELPPPPAHLPPPPPGEDPPRRRVCKCIDPENGEECDHDTPGAVSKDGANGDNHCPYAVNNGGDDGPPNGDEVGAHDRDVDGGDQPPPSEEQKDKDEARLPETLALKLSFDDDSNETTSYSATPQEEDVAHEMEDKSLQLAMAASRLAKEEQKKDESKSEVETLSQNATPEKKDDGKSQTTYQMQTDPVPEDVQDLKTMYQQMQAQLMGLQQAILTNQGAPQQQTAAVQLQQLQQLQQQMLLQQQLLLQQGMMMPPMMMQTSPPQMMVPMAPQPMMVPPRMQQPYMVPQQQQVLMMPPSVAVAQPTEQSLPSDTGTGIKTSPSTDVRGVEAPSLDKGGKEVPKREGSLDIAEEIKKEEGKPTSKAEEPVTERLSDGVRNVDVEKIDTKTEDSQGVDKKEESSSLFAEQTVSSKTESSDGSPSTRRKNVFADILKKKGKQPVKSNYVLSAQREMLNRQRSESDIKVKSTTQAPLVGRPRSGSDLPSREVVPTAEHSTAEGKSVTGNESLNSNSEKKDDTVLLSTAIKDAKSDKAVEDLSVSSRGSDVYKVESPKTDGEIPKAPSKVLASKKGTTVEASNVSIEKSHVNSKPNEKGDNLVMVTEFEADFALDSKSKVPLRANAGVMPDKLNNGSAPEEAKSTTSELPSKVPPKVAPKPSSKPPRPPPPHDGPRPFRKGPRPVSLASDRQSELQEMAGLSNVSRFKEMMANLKSKESTN